MLSAGSVSAAVAAELVGVDGVAVRFLRAGNHTWRIAGAGGVWYLKAHTKDWYGGDAVEAGLAVRHEVSGHRILAAAGLRTPRVVRASESCENALGWPYLLTAEAGGTSLVELLPTRRRDEADDVLQEVGRHLAGMHAIRFEHPGYLIDGAPVDGEYQHPCWRFERFLVGAIGTWAEDRTRVEPRVMDRLAGLLADSLDAVRRAFEAPRFTHGDCHANGFFLERTAVGWSVSGVLDLEVSSAGCPLFDFTKLFIELAGQQRGSGYRWWEPLFDGYGDVPDLNVIRLLLASSNHINFTCLGDHSWPGSRTTILERIVNADSWESLLGSEV